MVKRKAADNIFTVFLCVLALAVVSPVLFIAFLSFDGGGAAYPDFFIWNPQYVNALTNSIIISLGASLGTVVVSTLAAYVFAKVKFRGRDVLFYLYIIVMMMPFQVTLLPQYIVSQKIGVYDTPLAMILPGIFAPFAAFLLTQVMKTVPDDIIEAARLDTSSTLRIIWSIIILSVKHGIICAWALTFTEQWNMVAEPLVLMETEEKYPLTVLLSGIRAGDVLGFAAALVFSLLPLLIFTFFEEEIMDGLGEYKLK